MATCLQDYLSDNQQSAKTIQCFNVVLFEFKHFNIQHKKKVPTFAVENKG
jgi:hypothetical protein